MDDLSTNCGTWGSFALTKLSQMLIIALTTSTNAFSIIVTNVRWIRCNTSFNQGTSASRGQITIAIFSCELKKIVNYQSCKMNWMWTKVNKWMESTMSNSQGRNLGCSVSSARFSSLSSTQGIGLGREWLRYLTASLTKYKWQLSKLSYSINFSDLLVGCIFRPALSVQCHCVFGPALGWLIIHCYILSRYLLI